MSVHSTLEERRGEMARMSQLARSCSERQSLPYLGYAFPVYPPYAAFKASAQTSSLTTTKMITTELGASSGPRFQERGTHSCEGKPQTLGAGTCLAKSAAKSKRPLGTSGSLLPCQKALLRLISTAPSLREAARTTPLAFCVTKVKLCSRETRLQPL